MPLPEKHPANPNRKNGFFKLPPRMISDEVLRNPVLWIEQNIDHVPNKKIGHPKARIIPIRRLINNSLPYFGDFALASAYISLLYRTAQCGEFSYILYTILGPSLPKGTIVEIFLATWDTDNHAYIKVKLPPGYIWQDGERVRFCDVWYKRTTADTQGVYTALEMNQVLKNIGSGEKPIEISSLYHKVVGRCTMFVNNVHPNPSHGVNDAVIFENPSQSVLVV